jgi:hypothetical protein
LYCVSQLFGDHFPFNYKIFENQHVKIALDKTSKRVCGRAHDGLTANIERRIQDQGTARSFVECIYECRIAGRLTAIDSLRPGGAVNVGDGW